MKHGSIGDRVRTALLILVVAAASSGALVTEIAMAETLIRARDYGALADDGQDDTAAMAAALEACRNQPSPRLVLDPGRYHFAEGANPAHPQHAVRAHGIHDLTIDGGGAELIFSGLLAPFSFAACRNLTVQNLVIDWERPPFSIGPVVAAATTSFDVAVWNEFPVQGGEPVQAFMDFDPQTLLPRSHGLDVYHGVSHTELVGPQRLRVHTRHPTGIQPGVLAVLRHQVYSFNAFWLERCVDSTLRDITVYAVPGMGLVGSFSENITLRRFNVRLRPGTRRLVSATADATHFKGCSGLVSIEDCLFEGMGDDAVNVGGLYLTTHKRVDDRTVEAAHNLKIPYLPDSGDTIEFIPPETLLPYASGRVHAATQLPGQGEHRIEFEQPLPEGFAVGHLLANATKVPRVEIRNCTARNNRARGFLIQTRGAVIENCHFENCTSGGLWVLTEAIYFFESIGTRDVVARNNTFINCNYGGPLGEGVLSVYAYLKDFAFPPQPGVHRNIALEGNVIHGADNCGIFIAGADGIALRDNVITMACRKPTKPFGAAAIHIMSSRDVTMTGNQVPPDLQGAAFKDALTLGPGCDEATLRLQGVFTAF